MTPTKSRVAKALNTTEAEALEFISLVRARLDWPARHAWIAKCLEEFPDIPHTPEGVAAKLVRLGWAGPPEIQKRIPRSSIPKTRRKVARRSRKLPRVSRAGKQNYSPPPQSWPGRETIKSDTFDKTHVSVGKFPTCSHGIPKTRPCAICEPERFLMLNGPD